MTYLKKNHKFGLELLKTLEQALALDAKNFPKKWRMSVWHLRFYKTGKKYT